MKPPHESPDPFLRSLADEARDLPARAATEARRRAAERKENRQRLALAATVSVLGLVTWLTLPPRDVGQTTIASHHTASPNKASAPAGSSGTENTGKGSSHLAEALPAGLNAEQAVFVKALEGQPLLLVRDASGKVSRIHVFER